MKDVQTQEKKSILSRVLNFFKNTAFFDIVVDTQVGKTDADIFNQTPEDRAEQLAQNDSALSKEELLDIDKAFSETLSKLDSEFSDSSDKKAKSKQKSNGLRQLEKDELAPYQSSQVLDSKAMSAKTQEDKGEEIEK